MRAFLQKHRLLIAGTVLTLLCLFCLWRFHAVTSLLPDQKAAERWQGDSPRRFAQVSCFLPGGEKLTRDQIHSFRGDMAKKLQAASLDPASEQGLLHDAWCGFGSVTVANGRRSGVCRVVAAGGGFFDFHPLRLINGNYLREEDVMEDRVLLDRETAWLLFGASDLAGMSFSINGVPFVVAGVYEHENDAFSRMAAQNEMCIYMRYDAYEKLFPETAAIGCYELIMAEPVKDFAAGAVREKFPVKSAEFAENTYRFEAGRLLRQVFRPEARSMRLGAAVYPAWENAARAAEVRAGHWLAAALFAGSIPLALFLFSATRLIMRGKRKLEEDFLPEARERAEEAVRIRGRRRWERKHPEDFRF